ncbi:hypothetical protein GCM10020000_39450 [Streptomyces olivoverticillatus]
MPQGRQPRGLRLQGDPQLQDVAHTGELQSAHDLARVSRGDDERALALPGTQHSGMHEDAYGLADRVAAHLELLGQGVLGRNPLPDRPLVGGDLSAQLIHDGVHERLPSRCLQCHPSSGLFGVREASCGQVARLPSHPTTRSSTARPSRSPATVEG